MTKRNMRQTRVVILACESCGRYEASGNLDGYDLCVRCVHAVLEHRTTTVQKAYLVDCEGACVSRTRRSHRRRRG
jgi:hypothetical protein